MIGQRQQQQARLIGQRVPAPQPLAQLVPVRAGLAVDVRPGRRAQRQKVPEAGWGNRRRVESKKLFYNASNLKS